MRIAFTAQEANSGSLMEARFGRAPFFLIRDTDKKEWEVIDNQEAAHQAHGAGPKAAQKLFDAKAAVLITGIGPGNHARQVLDSAGIKTYLCPEGFSLSQALEAYEAHTLQAF